MTYVQIDTIAIKKNVAVLRNLLGSTQLMAIVKANAYGFDMVSFAFCMRDLGVDWVGVGTIDEAMTLRESGITLPILVLTGVVHEATVALASKHDIAITISCDTGLEALQRHYTRTGLSSRIHIKIDTGMHRQGFSAEHSRQLFMKIKESLPHGFIEGLYTHFGAAENPRDRESVQVQIDAFQLSIQHAKKSGFAPMIHAATTTSAMIFPDTQFDIARIGGGLYGIWPSEMARAEFQQTMPFQPALSWVTTINEAKRLPRGGDIGYDFTAYVAPNSRIAILPVGYWHGYRRSISNRGAVLLHGKRAPIVGRISMYMTAIDVTEIPQASVGDTVTLIGKNGEEYISLEEVGSWAETLNKDIACGIHPSIKRTYI
jgi:alanine racemase